MSPSARSDSRSDSLRAGVHGQRTGESDQSAGGGVGLGIPTEEALGVAVGHHRHLVVGNALQRVGDLLLRVRPRGVGVGVVALPHDPVDADVMAGLDAHALADEADPDVATEDVGRTHVVDTRPVAVTLPGAVGPLEGERHPADAALRHGELDRREAARDLTHDQVGARHPRRGRGQGDALDERRVARRHRHHAARADVHAHGDVGLARRLPQRVPVVGRERRQPERHRVLGERDRPGAEGGAAPDLGGHQHGIPQLADDHRDVHAGHRRAPLLDQPVVVRLYAEVGEVLVVGLEEGDAGETGERRESTRCRGRRRASRSRARCTGS